MEKLKKVVISNRKLFIDTKNDLIERKEAFIYESSGSIDRIKYNGKEFISIDLEKKQGGGFHLSKFFFKDVNKWIANNGETMTFYGNNYSEQMFNVDAIEKNLGKCLTMIDINDCYWRTAYLLGYISYETYIVGKRKKDWKIGRNACIGSLCKSKVISPYENGKMLKSARRVERMSLQHQSVRNHIITHVYKMFNYLFSQMGDSFFMYLTDCLVTSYDKKKWVENYFSEEGYKTKSKPIEFLSLDRIKKRVNWIDFEATKKQEDGSVKTGVNRYYEYSNSQVIKSTIEDTTNLFKLKA
jgi:hypothetical protein